MKNFGSNAPKMPTEPPMPKCKPPKGGSEVYKETPPPTARPMHYYKEVFVIIQGETRRYDNADVYLFDNLLTIREVNGAKAYFNFNNIIGVSCYD